jgi:hypothetical protein
MVTKMKMFGLFSQNQVIKKTDAVPVPVAPATTNHSTSALKQFNMASIMKMQSTGCKSCRG